ncbi:DUF1702 family protein [Allorhizocola rhizosphaerae]|uniref:DUF1702 family protein n=1 Tax=Allorhizocola rhizosphaerae TaxID=1872709 RepID=UPI000E3DA33D|nr:DUF1702 family protein [Allorhizocola rhizosphaerae]
MRMLRRLRCRLLTPPVSATRLDARGFHVKSAEARDRLETIGATFLRGFGYAALARTAAEAEGWLERVPVPVRGFAYEGAAMGLAIRDALSFGRARHVADLLAGRGDQHIYMSYIGVGWALARLPRRRWHRLTAPDPLLRWLALDGYGFHQAYFRTEQYVLRQRRDVFPGWPKDGPRDYAARAIDQGIGRALWFVGGTDVDVVGRLVNRFADGRRADLYSGVGLAATYAGGVDAGELTRLWRNAGPYRVHIAQGSAFAAKARVRAGLVVPHNEIATEIFCGMSTHDAAKITDKAREGLADTGAVPAYEIWRQRIADELVSQGRQ